MSDSIRPAKSFWSGEVCSKSAGPQQIGEVRNDLLIFHEARRGKQSNVSWRNSARHRVSPKCARIAGRHRAGHEWGHQTREFRRLAEPAGHVAVYFGNLPADRRPVKVEAHDPKGGGRFAESFG